MYEMSQEERRRREKRQKAIQRKQQDIEDLLGDLTTAVICNEGGEAERFNETLQKELKELKNM